MPRAAFGLMCRFGTDERGSVAVIFGLVVTVLLFAGGMAVDYARFNFANTKISNAADAAALAGGRALLDGRLSDNEVKAFTLKMFNENMADNKNVADIQSINVVLDRANGTVKVAVDAQVPTTLTRVGGIKTLNAPTTSTVGYEHTDIELGMALDITGSMAGSKIADLKIAAKSLVDILLPDAGTPNKVRIALAPYAAAVNAGVYAGAVSNFKSNDGCVRERSGTDAFTDAKPDSKFTYFAAGGKPVDIDATEGKSSYSCPSAKIEPLTNKKAQLLGTIKSFNADGFTAGHLGAAWAWYLISPEWGSIWPSDNRPAPADGKTIKAIILMTDGLFNTAYANGNSNVQAQSICGEMKKPGKDVIVYAVGFQAPSSAEATLKACASSPFHYFKAENGSQLQSAFMEIATTLNNLRLTQ